MIGGGKENREFNIGDEMLRYFIQHVTNISHYY